MHYVKNDSTPTIFQMTFNFPNHYYPTGLASNNFVKPEINFTQAKFQISVRVPRL